MAEKLSAIKSFVNYTRKFKLKKHEVLFPIFLLAIFAYFVKDARAAVTGQIVVDPQNSRRIVYHNTTVNGHPKPVILCGAGDPEEFFFVNTQNSLNLLRNSPSITGRLGPSKTTYIMAYNGDYCTGVCGPPSNLDAWDSYMDDLENAGVTIVFFFFDDGVSLTTERQNMVATLVNKLKTKKDDVTPRKLLIWSVAEEFSEGLSTGEVGTVANIIKNNDQHGHVIGVHQAPGTNFQFNNNPNLQMFLMQLNNDNIDTMNSLVNTAWANNPGKILNMAENIDHATDSETLVRQRNWAAIMGGASIVQVHKMGGANYPSANNAPVKYNQCQHLTNFMEATRVNFMSPSNNLKAGSTEWVLAEPGFSYVLYTRNGGSPGLTNLTSGTYNFTWMDTAGGTKVTQNNVSIGSGTQTWAKPSSIGNELALYVVKTTGTPPTNTPTPQVTPTPTSSVNKAPVAQNVTVSTSMNQSVYVQLQFTDNDGPGPYIYTITQQPTNGTLSGSTNDRTYTPNSGYTGTDSFKWKVNDGLVDSNIATVSINISGSKPGDANGDGRVDIKDYAVWISNYNKNISGPLNGDFNGNGKVDGLDYLIWLKNYTS